MTVRKSPSRSTQKSAFIKAVESEDNYTLTENMAVTHKSTLNSVLDLFAMGGALRTRSDDEVQRMFSKAYADEPLLALKTMFYLRDIRGGQGERKSFRTMFNFLCEFHPEVAIANMHNVAEYGRYDDLKVMIKRVKTRNAALQFINSQLLKDIQLYKEGKSISLLAKWMPSENTSSSESKALAKITRKYMGINSKQYRKILSMLRKHIDIVERKMSAGEWDEIAYGKVPSKASLMYKDAFNKHDTVRYNQFVQDVMEGKKTINASALYPYEVVRTYFNNGKSETLDALWKSLPDYTGAENAIVVADVSGSMFSNRNLPISISISLALYFAERNKGAFNGYFMTFSSNPSLEKVRGKSFSEKIQNLSQANWDMSTNIQGAFDLILNAALKDKLPQEELPSKIYVVSDMEFNNCGRNTNLELIKKKFKEAGYKMPLLVFWNADSRNDNVAARFDERGVFLVSGASPTVFKYAMDVKAYNPLEFMLSVLNNERYSRVVV